MAKFLVSILLVLTWPLAALWRGYVISVLWFWFASPILGIRQITSYEAVAAVLVLGAVLPWHPPTPDETDDNKFWDRTVFKILIVTVGPALFLLAGWIWKSLQWGAQS